MHQRPILLWAGTTAVFFSLVSASVAPTQAQKRPYAAEPVVTLVQPNMLVNDTNMPVTIIGSGIDPAPVVRIGPTTLRDVNVTDGVTVTAIVPWGIQTGVYTLTVTNPDQQIAQLVHAVTITLGAETWASNGPYGGNIYDVVLDPISPTHLYAPAQRSGLFVTSDAASSWGMTLVAPFPYRPQVAYPVSNQPPVVYIGGDGGLGMMRSLDYGQTWQLSVPPEFAMIQSNGGAALHAFVRPDEPAYVYAGLDARTDIEPLGGLYKSTDQGDTWAAVSSTMGLHVTALSFDPASPDQNMALGTRDGKVLTSTDGGVTWGTGSSVTGYIGKLIYAPSVYSGTRTLWAVANDCQSDGNDYLYRSDNGGTNWTSLQLQPGSYNFGVSYHSTISGLLWSAIGNGYYSVDDGANWIALNPGLSNVTDFAVVPGSVDRATTVLYASTKNGIYRSTDGGDHWQETDTGLAANLARTIAISPFNADEAYAATSARGMLHTWDGGRSWQSLNVPQGNYGAAIATDPFSNGKVYFGYGNFEDQPVVRISTDHGMSYATHALTMPVTLTGQRAYVSAFAAHASTHNRLLAGVCVAAPWPQIGPGLIYASSDGGISWNQQTTPADIKCITRLVYDPQNDQVVYAGTNGTGLLRSGDGGATWALMPHQSAGMQILALVIDPRDSNSIYLSSFGGDGSDVGIFASHDGGDTWVKMTGTSYPIWELKFVKVGASYWLYAATMNGLRYLTTIPADPTTEWQYASGLASVATIDGFNAATEDGRVVYYIGTSGGTLPATLVAQSRNLSPSDSQTISAGIYRNMVRVHMLFLPILRH